VPQIEDVLGALRASPGCRFARMSGSGATCFAIFDHYAEGADAAARLQIEREWWARPTWLKLPS
jgi:4-diphosphocytidyl-2-C-methyl-D-erythritol kinase